MPEPSVLNADATSRILLFVDHASNHVPDEFGGLGLRPEALEDHIGWDIGVARLTHALVIAVLIRTQVLFLTDDSGVIEENGAEAPDDVDVEVSLGRAVQVPEEPGYFWNRMCSLSSFS